MTTLANAPLVEVVTQFRWGVVDSNEDGESVGFAFEKREQLELPEEFARVLASAGWSDSDVFAPELDDVQFAVSRRFRRGADVWPVFQTGLGVFTVNQRNDEYEWSEYKASVLHGYELLVEALARFHQEPPFIGVELLYLDSFPLNAGQNPYQFLRKHFNIRPTLPKEFIDVPFLDNEPSSASLFLELQITDPVGALRLNVLHEEFDSSPAYLMETRVLSVRGALEFTRSGLNEWLEAAHRVQRHAFQTLIKPTYMKSFA